MWVGGYIIRSPCIGICKLENEVCFGCFRTSTQISEWAFYTDEERETIMKESKPIFATADIDLIRDLIVFTLKTQDDFSVPVEKKKEFEALYHRLGRFKESSWHFL